MAGEPEIKTFRLEDVVVGGVSSKFKVLYDTARAATAESGDVPSVSCVPLDDISAALYDSYLKGSWSHKGQAGQPSQELYAAVLRVLLLPWGEPPQAVAASLPGRLQRGRDLAAVMGAAPALHEQALVRALEANSQLATELQLQAAAIRDGTLLGANSGDAALSKEAYAAWQSSAMQQCESLLAWYCRLPEYNGLLQAALVGAHGLQLGKKPGLFSKPTTVSPYANIAVFDAAGNRVGQRHTSSVQSSNPNPSWGLAMPPVTLLSDGCELLCKVKHAPNRSPSAADTLVGRSGVKLRGLQPYVPIRMELDVYGSSSDGGGGLCGCFGGGPPPVQEDDLEEGGSRGKLSAKPGGEMDSRVVYDPESDQMRGVAGRLPRGCITLELTYLHERRPRPQQQGGASGGGVAGQGGARTYGEHLTALLQRPLPQDPGRSAEAMAAFRNRHQKAKVWLADPSHHAPSPGSPGSPSSPSAPSPLDTSSMFRQLAAMLHHAHRSNLTRRLQPFGAEGGAGQGMQEAGKATDTMLLATLEGIAPHPMLAQLLQHPAVAPHLPLGWGLPLLLQFGKLYGVRPELQRIVIMQYLVIESGGAVHEALDALHVGWKPCVVAQHMGALTADEAAGVAAVMGLVLHHALPTINNHYARFSPDREGGASFLALLRMVGWAITWDPQAELPAAAVRDTLVRAASARLARELRVNAAQLDSVIAQVTEEARSASCDMSRDFEIEAALPGLGSGYVAQNAALRYHTLTDHLEMVFAYNPGSNLGDLQPLFDMEAAILNYHQLLLEHDLAVDPTAATTLPKRRAANGASGGGSSSSPSRMSLYDLETHMISALDAWISKGGDDLRQRCPRILELETWSPVSLQEPFGRSAVELQGMMSVYLERWLEAACVEGHHRRQRVLGRTIVRCLVELMSGYAKAFEAHWEQMLATRDMSMGALGKARHTPSKSAAAKPFSAAGPQPSAPSGLMPVASLRGVRSMLVSSSVRKQSEGGNRSDLPDAEALADALQQAEPGITLSNAMCTLRATLSKLIADTRDLGENLADYLIEPPDAKTTEVREGGGDGPGASYPTSPASTTPVSSPSARPATASPFTPSAEAGARGAGGEAAGLSPAAIAAAARAAGLSFPEEAPPYLTVAWPKLIARQQHVLESLTLLYSLQYRDSLLRMFMSAFGPKGDEPNSTRALEGILTAVHDELTCITRNFRKPPSTSTTSTTPSTPSLASDESSGLVDMVVATWKGAMSSLKLLALNQANFRALQPQEADWAREFLLSLKAMYEDEVPHVMAHRLKQHEWDAPTHKAAERTSANGHGARGRAKGGQQAAGEAGGEGAAGPVGSALRAVHYGYCSALLQALTAESSDLVSMYEAQFSCLQQAQLHAGGVFVELGPSQISLLDLLRILKQRRRLEDQTKLFVNQQLQQAEAIATQVLFGLSSQERVVAEFRCFLATDGDQTTLAAHASSRPHTPRAGPGEEGAAGGTMSKPSSLRNPPASSLPQSLKGLLTKASAASTYPSDGSPDRNPLASMTGTGGGGEMPQISVGTAGRLYLTQSCVCFTTMLDGDRRTTSDTTLLLLRGEVAPALCQATMGGAAVHVAVFVTEAKDCYCMAGFPPGDAARLVGLLTSDAGAGAASPARQLLGGASSPLRSKVEGADAASPAAAVPPSRLGPSGSLRQQEGAKPGSGQAAAQPTPAPTSGDIVMSVPCYLYGKLLNTDGCLYVFKDRLDFINKDNELVHSVPLDCIEQIGQRPVPKLNSASGNLLTLQVAGARKRELEFGGVTDALIASLKSTLSDLCFSA